MARIKTRYVGVYYRYGKNRYAPDGKPDKCYDIHYKAHDKYIWEKIGWRTEGYTIQDAIEIRGQRVKALRHPELCPPSAPSPQGVTFNELWDIYKEKWLPNLKSSKDIEYTYGRHLKSAFGDKLLTSITTLDVETFKQDLLKQEKGRSGTPLKHGTVKIILANFRRIMNKAETWGLVSEKLNPAANVHVANADHKRERYLTPQEVEKLFDGLQFVSCTLYHIAKIAVHTGMRLGEILAIKGQYVDIESGIIYVDGKTGKRCAYISEELKIELQKILPKAPSEYLFLTLHGTRIPVKWISKNFSKVVDAVGFNKGISDTSQKVVFHTLRHTFCSWLAIKGVPLYTIGELVGHRSVDMTKRYAKLSPDSKRDALKYIAETLL